MKHHLTFTEETSNKFWSIETSGKSFTVTYGKTGTAGTSQTKTFDTEEKCLKEADKLLREKLKKGYSEIQASTPTVSSLKNYLKQWEEIVSAKDLPIALTKHFFFLADSPGFSNTLEGIMKEAKKIRIEGDSLIVEFKKGILVATKPANTSSYKKFPVSFQTIIQHHEKLCYNSKKRDDDLLQGDVMLGKNYFDFDIYDEEDKVYKLFKGKEENVLCPLHQLDQVDWIYNPKKKNKLGEPALFPVIHEEEDEINIVEENVGSLFLKSILEMMGLNVLISTASVEKSSEPWWENVVWATSSISDFHYHKSDGKLNAPFPEKDLPKITELMIDELTSLHSLPFNKLTSLKELNLRGGKKKIQNLDGLVEMNSLESLNIEGNAVEDITPIAMLVNLKYLNIERNKVQSLTCLTSLQNLKTLHASNNKIKDVSAIRNLTQLENISISDNPVKDISPLFGLRKLETARIPSKMDKKELKKLNPKVAIS